MVLLRTLYKAPRCPAPPGGNPQAHFPAFGLTRLLRGCILRFLRFLYRGGFMKKAAVGFRVHSGWSAIVAVSFEKSVPIVLRRQRAQLVETFSYTFRQPYHTGEKMGFADAGEFIAGVRAEAERLASRGLHAMQA